MPNNHPLLCSVILFKYHTFADLLFKQESAELSISLDDGNSVRIWIRATDVMNNTAVDRVLVHVDSTPAHIGDVGLMRDGESVPPMISLVELQHIRWVLILDIAEYLLHILFLFFILTLIFF